MATLRKQAQAKGMSPATLAHLLLLQALGAGGTAAKTPARADEGGQAPLLGRLRALLAVDLSVAHGWTDLQERLAAHGYTFRERGGGLALYCTATAARTCKASDLGWSYADLMRRFGAPFPGHAQLDLARRMVRRADPGTHPSLFPDMEDEDIILFEDE
ncbi:hypothetical protein KUL25_15630 [Rhodobacteraceae bacterium N5(2021)]|uniref:Uncharacterized protein n=1 Tax=Gymnodinialimonas phycosphaerae TaxID=2841589 RepID=A0A975TSL6_9RHOB|nr:hypothetical protein [Gymnodinialimonas phycosphaerae]MBY4894188.1 hypothetical protein [Gymnodinialimonas phycosphaerae]